MAHLAVLIHLPAKAMPRYGSVLSALALGLGIVAGAAAPAGAACSGSARVLATGTPGESYTCNTNCTAGTFREGEVGPSAGSTTHRGDRATPGQCLEDCSRNRRCATVSYQAYVSYGADGVGVPVIECNMYSAGELSTRDAPPGAGPHSYYAICFRNPTTPLRDLQLQLDTRFHQDQFRPSFPPGGSPANQYRGK